MTREEAEALVKERGSIKGAARAAGMAPTTFRRLLGLEASASPTPSPQPSRAPGDVSSIPGGINLKGVRMLDKKPADSVKRLIYTLKRGMGYPLDALSHKWGISEETIRSHARRFEAIKYVETAPGQWTPCVMHPDTAAECERR